MFSKDEAKHLRQEFWTEFGKTYPRKWLLYRTKIKELNLKFTFNNKLAQVSVDIDTDDSLIRDYYYEKIWSLEKILKTEYLPKIILNPNYEVNRGKFIARAYVQLDNVSVYNKQTWPETFEFLYSQMEQLELFFYEYEDFIKD